jgi:hypothetical protein
MDLTPELRGARRPWNLLEAPLPKLVPKDGKRGHTCQGYKGVHGRFEKENRHVKKKVDAQNATSAGSI